MKKGGGGKSIKDFSGQLIGASALVAFYCFAILWPLGSRSIIFITTALGSLFFVCLCVCVWVSAKNYLVRLSIIGLALILALSAVMVIIFHQSSFSFDVLNALVAAGLVFVIYLIKPIHVRIPLYVFIGIFLGLVFWEIDLDESIIAIGQNGITLHFLVLYVVYFFRTLYPMSVSGLRVVKYENYVFAVALFMLAVWSQGRAAALTSLIVLCAASLILMSEFAGRKKYWVVLASLLVVFFNYSSPPLMGERPYSALDRLELNGVSDIRYKLWLDYFETLTPESVVMGNRDSNCHNILQGYGPENCNVHSSYLRAHQVYGLSGIFVISLIILWCFRLFAQRGEWFVMLIILALLARVATDEAFFTSPYLCAFLFIYAKVMNRVQLRGSTWSAK